MRWQRSSFTSTLLCCGVMACVSACSDSDDPVTTVDEKTAERQALGAVEVADAMLTNTDEIATGALDEIGRAWQRYFAIPEGRTADEPVWDAENGQWIILVTYQSDDPAPHALWVHYTFSIQYTNGDGSHPMSPAKETNLAVYRLVADMRDHSYGNGDATSSDLHYDCAMNITALQASNCAVTGNGSMTGTLEGEKDGREIDYELDMAFVLDASVPRDGRCGTGSLSASLHSYDLIAAYGPAPGTYTWQFSRWGVPISSGTGSTNCSKNPTPVSHPDTPPSH